MNPTTAAILRDNDHLLLFDEMSHYTPWDQAELDLLGANDALASLLGRLIVATKEILAFSWHDHSAQEAAHLTRIEKEQTIAIKNITHFWMKLDEKTEPAVTYQAADQMRKRATGIYLRSLGRAEGLRYDLNCHITAERQARIKVWTLFGIIFFGGATFLFGSEEAFLKMMAVISSFALTGGILSLFLAEYLPKHFHYDPSTGQWSRFNYERAMGYINKTR